MMEFVHAFLSLILGLFGAIAGAVAGYFLFFWLTGYGLYALVLPGALTGLGAGLAAGRGSVLLALMAGTLALVAGVFTEWQFAPFHANKMFPYFVAHLAELKPVTLVMLGVGTLLAFWLALRAGRSSAA